MRVGVKVQVGIANLKGRQCYTTEDPAKVVFPERGETNIFLWKAEDRQKHCNQVELRPQPRFRVWIFG